MWYVNNLTAQTIIYLYMYITLPHLKLNGCEVERVAVHHRVRPLLWHCVGKDVENLQNLSKSYSKKDSRLLVATMMRF